MATNRQQQQGSVQLNMSITAVRLLVIWAFCQAYLAEVDCTGRLGIPGFSTCGCELPWMPTDTDFKWLSTYTTRWGFLPLHSQAAQFPGFYGWGILKWRWVDKGTSL